MQPASRPASGVFAQMSQRTRGMLLLGAAALAAVVAAAYLWSASPSYRVLFTNLSDRDGGAIIAQLAQLNIPYRSGEGGTILVPQAQVHEARLKLASLGLPKGSVVGFEIMETQRFGVTQFQEQVNFQRALEGELARSIQSLAPVAAARVHLALPKQSGFLRDRQPPTASVLVQVHAGRALDRQQVAGVVHLVSSSVPELSPKNVSVVDQHGNLLASERQGAAGLDAAQLDYVARIESETIRRIEDILEPILGRGNVRAQVTADVDFSQVETMAETFGPNQGDDSRKSIRSQSVQESSQPGSSAAQGVPGALSNQPPVPPTAPINGAAPPLNPTQNPTAGSASTRRDEVINFEVDKNVRHTRVASGQLRRLTAAVVVNHRIRPGADGAAASNAPLTEDELRNVNVLVREAMGFSEARGDSLNVVNSAFNTTDLAPPPALPLWQQPDAIALTKEIGQALLFLLLTLIVVFGVVRPALKAVANAPAAAPPQPAQPLAPQALGGGAATALTAPDARLPPSPIDQVRELARNDPATVANVVKAWVGEGKNG